MRPTLRRLPCPEMPVTRVPKMSGATMTLISRKKISLNTRRCSANCGRSSPISPPRSMAKKIQRVSDWRHNPVEAMASRPAHRRATIQAGPETKSGNAAPAAKSNSPTTRNTRMIVGCWSFVGWFTVATLMDLFYESPRKWNCRRISLHELFRRSVHDGAARGSDQSSFVIGDDFDRHGFEQRLHAAFAGKCLHEQWAGQLSQHLGSNAATQVNSAGGHHLQREIPGFGGKDRYEKIEGLFA